MIASLKDDDVLARVRSLRPGQTGTEMLRTARVVDRWVDEIAGFTEASTAPSGTEVGADS